MLPVTIATSRLNLRPFAPADAGPFHQILCGKDVLRYFPRSEPPPRERVEKWIQQVLAHWQAHGYGLWAVESRASGALMGRSGLQWLPETNEIEVDFLLGENFWGQGFATEAGQAGLRFGLEKLAVEFVVGIVHPENLASQRVLEKIGMTRRERACYFGMDCFRYTVDRPTLRQLYGAQAGPGE
jgi:RimJ/RimL family protein N-acetyltransferase